MKIKTPKREVKSFRNKYLALSIISLLFFTTSQAQFIKPNNSYGTTSNGQNIERVLFFPTGCGPDTLNLIDSAINKYAIYGDSCNNKVYFYNPKTKTWSTIGASASDITGLISEGSNITITGTGTSGDPYVINSTGGGSGNTKYILQGYGTIIDSSDANHYTVSIDTTIKSPINVVKPIKAIDSTTIGLDSLNMPELRYSQAARDTSNWKDSTLIDKKYLNDRIAGISGGSMPANYVDTTSQPNDSTIRIHFAVGNYVDYIIRAPQIDTSHLSDRIDANAANIATNTSAIAANTTAIAGKQDAITLTTTGTSGAATLTGSTLNIPNYATGGGGGVVDTTGTLNTIHNNKGFLFADSTLSGNHNSPDIVQSGRTGGKKNWWGTYVDGGITNGSWNLYYSSDSGTTKHVLLNALYNGTWSLTGNWNVSSYITATQFVAGTKFNVVATNGGQMSLGQNFFNPRASFIISDTAKGFISNRGSTAAARMVTSNIYTASITGAGTGYTNVSNTLRVFTAISGYAPDFSTNVTISGGALTSFGTASIGAYGARVGDTYTCSNCGAGSGMVVTVTALTGDTARGLQYYDSSLNQMLVWNGQAYSHEVNYLTNTTYSLLHGPDYIFTGTSAATWTLPAVSTSHVGDGNTISIMNMGTVSITLNSFSGSKIIPTGSITPQASLTIASGSTVKLFPTGTAFKVLYNN